MDGVILNLLKVAHSYSCPTNLLHTPAPSHFISGGGITEGSGEGPGGEAGDTEDEADGGQGKAERAWKTQDPAGAASRVEDQNAGAAGRPAETTQRGQEGKNEALMIYPCN